MTMPDPTGVSGPGPLSQRTDIQPLRAPTGMPYGEQGPLLDAQRAVPLPESNPPMPNITGLGDPTARASEPVTAGAAAGPGPGPEVLSTATGDPRASGPISRALAKAAASDPSGELAALLSIAEQRGV